MLQFRKRDNKKEISLNVRDLNHMDVLNSITTCVYLTRHKVLTWRRGLDFGRLALFVVCKNLRRGVLATLDFALKSI